MQPPPIDPPPCSALRTHVLEASSRLVRSGLVSGTWGVLACRNDAGDAFAVTPSGMAYTTLTPDDIVLVGLDGNVVHGHRRPSSETPFLAHLFRERPDVNGIVHTHSTAATAFAVARRPIPAALAELVEQVGGEVPCAAYARFGTREMAEAVLSVAGDVSAVLLANHGVVAFGPGLDDALTSVMVVEEAARVTLAALLLGSPVVIGVDEQRELRRLHLHHYGQPRA